jgi:hypothetical protein
MKTWIAILVSAAIAAVIVAPARAQVSADLAKKCRAMMVKAHQQ